MNFLKEVLSTQDEVEAVNLNEQYQCILQQINNVKREVTKFLQEKYVEFEPISSQDEILSNKCKKLCKNMEKLLIELSDETKKDIRCTLDEIKTLKESANETKIEISICDQLLEINLGLDVVEDYLHQKQYVEASKEITRLQNLIENPKYHVDSLDIFVTLRDRFLETKVRLMSRIKNILNNYLEITYPDEENKKCAELKVSITNFDDFQIALGIAVDMNIGLGLLNELATFLLNEVFDRIILKHAFIETTETESYVSMNVSSKNKDIHLQSDVIKNIRNVFRFLENYLDVIRDDESLTIRLIGNRIGDDFCTKIVESFLIDLIPSSPTEMDEFRTIKSEIIELHDMLIENQFLHSQNNPINDFIGTVDSRYADKLCQNILKKAETIIKKDLHIMTEIQKDTNESIVLPKCYVSNNVIELKKYIFEIMDMAVVNTSEECVRRLIKTVKNIFSLYYILTPQHHKKMLETIPQQVALFYNNCIYLSYYLPIMQTKYVPMLPDNMKDASISFLDVLTGLRTTGDEMFKEQLITQKKQILDIIKDSGLSTLSGLSELNISSEKSIRQCLRQLELLQTVWMNVLPREVYDKSLGLLLNAMIEDLINKVLSAEDISAACATQLVAFFSIVKQRAPKVFSEPKEIYQQVELWAKFNEIIFLLEANLTDIDGRWADGKGALAVEFRPEELKNIIRALFQNTDRRAALLNKIK